MVDFAQINVGINTWLSKVKQKTSFASKFVLFRIKNFKNDTRIEQIVYPLVLVGLLLILISLVMFVL